MLFELRRYVIVPGRRSEWEALMRSTIAPYMTARGMVIVGMFLDDDTEDGYIWIRRFDDESHRTKLYDAVYGSDHWKNVITPLISGMTMVDEMTVTRMRPALGSVIQ